MGCPGCLLTERELQERKQTVFKNAKHAAIAAQKLYVLYRTADGDVGYMEATAASAAGVQPLEFVSHLTPHALGTVP